MFTYGQSFETALRDAQRKGYAESNPDADILGTDACRKTAILTALISGKLLPTDKIHTEGITKIRDEDVSAASKMGATIKLVGRGMCKNGELFAMVAPVIVPAEMPLSGVSGVYNAVEVIADPLGNVMFYGQGAGAGATASAVVGDLMQVMASGTNCASPVFEKCEELMSFDKFESKHYLALCKACSEKVAARIKGSTVIENGEEYALITPVISEGELASVLNELGVTPKSDIRVLA
jgi:homoserine dehydrogenase